MIRLAFVGPMLGCHSGYVPAMGEVLGEFFSRYGYPVVLTSTQLGRFGRLADIALTLLARRSSIDIQVLQIYGGRSFIAEDMASAIGKCLGQKIIMHIHGGAMPEFMSRYPRWGCRVLRRADMIVAPSAFLARTLRAYGFYVRSIPNVIELSHYPFRLRRRLSAQLFWMRNFHAIYNPEMAVRVLSRVRKHIPDATLTIAGQDKGRQIVVQKLVKELGLQDAVRFPGYLDFKTKVLEGNAADIFLNTNHVDNAPVTIIEACAMGIPVVATKVGGIPDLLIDGKTGLLVPDNDDRAMASAVLRLIREPNLAVELSANGRKLAESCSWDYVRHQWESTFAEVLNGGREDVH